MAVLLTSNRTVAKKRVSVEPYFPLAFVENCSSIHSSGDQQHSVRTFKKAAQLCLNWMKDEVESGRYEEREAEIQKLLAA